MRFPRAWGTGVDLLDEPPVASAQTSDFSRRSWDLGAGTLGETNVRERDEKGGERVAQEQGLKG